MHLSNFFHTLLLALLGLSGVSGLLALLSPRHFQILAAWSARWVDGQHYLAVLDRRFDIDALVLRHCRVLGALVIFSVSVLGYVGMARWHGPLETVRVPLASRAN